MSDPQDVTRLLLAAQAGDDRAHAALLPLVYDELRRRAGAMMRRERSGHTLQPTALVHEAYMRMVNQHEAFAGRGHFFALSAQMMRRVLVDHAWAAAARSAAATVRVQLDEKLQLSVERDHDVLALDEALTRLAELDARRARIVELRFGGLTVAEVAEVLEVSKRTVEAEWTMIKAWLRRELSA